MPISKKKLSSRKAAEKANEAKRRIAKEKMDSLLADRERLLAENQFLREDLAAAEQYIGTLQEQIVDLQEAVQSRQERLELVQEHADNVSYELDEFRANYKVLLERALAAKLRSTLYQHEQEKADLRRIIEAMKNQMPTLGNWKPYEQIGQKKTKDGRCATIVKVIEQFVGQANVDDFITHFVHYVSEKPSFSFTLALSPLDSYLICARWKISSLLLAGLRHFLQKKLGFDVLSARVPEESRRFDTRHLYDIKLVHETTTKSVIVELTDLRALLVKRLEFMDSNARLRLAQDEDLVVRYLQGRSEGGEVTMLVAVIVNSVESDKSHGFMLLGYYSGDEELLDEKLGRVCEQVNSLDSITYNETTRNVKREFGKLDDSQIDDFQSVFHTLKTRNHAAFRDAKLRAAAICQQMYNYNVMHDSGNLEILI